MAVTYEAIATGNGSGSSSTFTFSSIPSTYTDLILIFKEKPASGSGDRLMAYVNGDNSGSNYSSTAIVGNGSAASSQANSNYPRWYFDFGSMIQPSDLNNVYIIQFQNYSNTSTYKTILGRLNIPASFTSALVGLWRSTSAITSITIDVATSTISTDSTFTLYGIKAA